MKLYTKTGDDGTTSLFGGRRVPKDDLRVAAYGTIDELNSVLGLALAACTFDEIRTLLPSLQSRLFDLGADLATPREAEGDAAAIVARIEPRHIEELERWTDRASEAVPPLQQFILPGGTELASRLHLARTVCRRAERACVTLGRDEALGEWINVYLNRLGDLLFALARWANALDGVEDVPWVREGGEKKV